MTPFEEMCDSVKRSMPDLELVTITYKNTMGLGSIQIPRGILVPELGRKPVKLIQSLRHTVNDFALKSLNSTFPNWARSPKDDEWLTGMTVDDCEHEDDEDHVPEPIITKGKIIIDLYTEMATIHHFDYGTPFPYLTVKDIDVNKWDGI